MLRLWYWMEWSCLLQGCCYRIGFSQRSDLSFFFLKVGSKFGSNPPGSTFFSRVWSEFRLFLDGRIQIRFFSSRSNPDPPSCLTYPRWYIKYIDFHIERKKLKVGSGSGWSKWELLCLDGRARFRSLLKVGSGCGSTRPASATLLCRAVLMAKCISAAFRSKHN